ncbi:MAG: cleavage protein [Peptococcaceae bacterium]|nr:cleavage protein [Peptococcaceae bacterium]
MRNRICSAGCIHFREGRCMLENNHNAKKPECPNYDGSHGVAL